MSWYFAPEEDALWFSSGSNWQRHSKIPSRSWMMAFHGHGTSSRPTLPLQQAMVQIQPSKVILTGSGQIDQPATPKTSLTQLQQHTFIHDLMDDIWAGNGFSICDGSYQEGRGTAAWIIKGKTNENRLLGKCLSPSNNKDHSSFQSKLAGIHAILFTLSMLLETTIAIMPFRVVCNGKSVLMWLQWYQITDPNEPHTNLLSATRHLMKHCRAQIDLHHVKGHRDSKNFSPYTRDAMLNIEEDKLAKEKLKIYQSGPQTFHIPWSQGACYVRNHQIAK